MNQEEKIYQKIREASQKAEENSFPGMDKVWNRVEEKLDTKIIKKKSEVWKKLAIAASFLLFFTVGIQLFNTQKELTEPITPVVNSKNHLEQIESNEDIIVDKKIVKEETIENSNNSKTTISKPKAISSETAFKAVKEIAPSIVTIDKKISEPAKTSFAAEEITADVQFKIQNETSEKGQYNSASSNNVFYPNKGKIFAARSSNMKYDVLINEKEKSIQEKNDALVVINGELSKKKREELSSSEMDDMVELKNPIYIINGEEFSEESLFGEKPTSKYAPLNSQKIDSIKVYLPEEAKPIYGEKGNNGVVIISIKK